MFSGESFNGLHIEPSRLTASLCRTEGLALDVRIDCRHLQAYLVFVSNHGQFAVIRELVRVSCPSFVLKGKR